MDISLSSQTHDDSDIDLNVSGRTQVGHTSCFLHVTCWGYDSLDLVPIAPIDVGLIEG